MVQELLLNFPLEDEIVEMDTITDLIETETITETTEEAHETEIETEIEAEETKLMIETETGEVEDVTLTQDTVLPSTLTTALLLQTFLLIVHGLILKIIFDV